MATGGGLGRGTGRGLGILQQLKQKDKAEEVEKEEERRISPPPVSASVAPEKPKLPPFGRGGLMSSMLESRIAKRSETEEASSRKPSEPTASRLESVSTSPVEVEPRAQIKPPVTSGVQGLPVKSVPSGRGGGFMLVKPTPQVEAKLSEVAKALSPKQISPPPPTIVQVKPLTPPKVAETAPTVQKIEEKKAEQQPKQGEKKSSTGTKTETSQFASDISHKTMEKALEELKIEEIKRSSPVSKTGVQGERIELSTNYIKLKCRNAGVYQYVVHFDPPVEALQIRKTMVRKASDVIGNVQLFDGSTLFLPIMLSEGITIVNSTRPTDGEKTKLLIKLTKILPPEQIPPVVFNVIFRKIMGHLKMKQIGQHYYSPQQRIKVPQYKLEIWPGYSTAVQEYEDGLYLVADVSHKIIPSRTCLELLYELKESSTDGASFKQRAIDALIGVVVLTPYNNRTYRVDDILWDLSPRNEFIYHNGEQCSYQDYYKKHYNIEITDLAQPLLLNRAKKSKSESPTQQQEMVCLIPELCVITGLSDDMKKDFRVMRELANHTRLAPPERHHSLKTFIESITSTPNANKLITEWGLTLDTDTSNLQGRVFESETIMAGRNSILPNKDCDWNGGIGRNPVLNAVNLKNWVIVFTRKDAKVAENFAETCYNCCKQMGIQIDEPTVVQINDDRAETYVREIKSKLTENTQLVLIIFPTSRDDRYAAVKRLCCIDYPVPSQVVIAKTISNEKNLRSVAQKIILQMNCKLGGELWYLKIPIQKLMVVGIDVYHQKEKKYKSIAGFVSSLNNEQTRWYSKVCFQMVGQELVDQMKIAFENSIKKYQEVNGFLPDKIVIYRDGVSDGQINHVENHEVEQLKSVFMENYFPKLAVVVVQKRISARIFAVNQRSQMSNAPPGTIVDHAITRKEFYDFFLVSQHVRQGTVTPTHYIIVHDSTSFQVDHMQKLSYKLTHLYYNWPGTIRVPAPCQYAHKLAYLTGQFLQKEPDPLLCNRLFYL